MKLGEGGEAFFVFETTENIPAALQTSPPVSPEVSPRPQPAEAIPSIDLPEPEPLDLATDGGRARSKTANGVISSLGLETTSDAGDDTPRMRSPLLNTQRPVSGDWSGQPRLPVDFARSSTADTLLPTNEARAHRFQSEPPEQHLPLDGNESRSNSPPPVSQDAAVTRAINLSKKLWSSNIPTRITETGDLMLDMTGYKSTDEEALKAELVARKILTEELEGNYDIGSLIGEDEHGNLWIYSSVEAKEAADRKATQAGLLPGLNPAAMRSADAVSDPGYHSDDAQSDSEALAPKKDGVQTRRDSDSALDLSTAPGSPEAASESAAEGTISYAKTLRLTSDQLRALNLKSGENTMSFTVNKATCTASIYFWHHTAHIVISDIDGTITKSDAMGHLMNMVGRDWTHAGVAKLYTDISQNGYHILYLTSRSVGQADTTRNYLSGIVQDGYRLPRGPVILSPDRTMAALKREVYLRRPEVFKMACLRDIMNLFNPVPAETSPGGADSAQQQAKPSRTPFYAGFGNRLNDALSYRSVSIPPTRIFTINSNAEVSLNLLTLNKYRTSYVSMREIVDHYFPPISLLIKEGGEDYTDFNYWREPTLDVDDFSASESEDSDEEEENYLRGRPSVDESIRSEDIGDEDEEGELPAEMEDSYYSRGSMDSSGYAEGSLENSFMESVDDDADQGVSGEMLDGATPVADVDDGTAVDEEGLSEAMRELKMGSMADKTPVARPKVVGDELGELRPLTTPPASPRR